MLWFTFNCLKLVMLLIVQKKKEYVIIVLFFMFLLLLIYLQDSLPALSSVLCSVLIKQKSWQLSNLLCMVWAKVNWIIWSMNSFIKFCDGHIVLLIITFFQFLCTLTIDPTSLSLSSLNKIIHWKSSFFSIKFRNI